MSDTKNTLFLLDAYALIFRAYYAFIRAPRINSKGLNTSAAFGFTNTLLDILKNQNPTHLAVVIDYPGPTFRNEMYTEYKANRDATPEDIKNAVPYIKRILEALNIPLLEIEGFEADDVIGTLAKKATGNGFDTYMVTPDKDFAQLVNEDIKMYKPKSRGNEVEIWGPDEVREQFGVPEPLNVIDVLALWGDAADNIPGCPGIGEKRSKDIIGKYHTIENVYENLEDFSGKQKENLANNREQVELARKLVTINTEVPVDVSIDSLKRAEPDLEKLRTILDELEFRTLWERITGESKAKAPQPAQGSLFGDDEIPVRETTAESLKTLDDVKHQYFLADNEMAIQSLAMELSIQKEFCFDTETSSINVWESSLVGIAFSWKAGEAYYVPVPSDRGEAEKLLEPLKSVFEDANILKIGQNLKFDTLMLKLYGIQVAGPFFDTMVAHHLIQPGLRHNMDYLAEIYLKYKPVSIEELIGEKGKKQGSMRDVPLEKVKEYAGEDADVTFQLKQKLEKELENEKLTSFFADVEMPLLDVLVQMEYNGVRIDVDELENSGKELEKRLELLEKEIMEMAGVSFNVNSPRQVGEVLFDTLKIDAKAGRTKSGQYTTNEEVLQKLKDKHPIIPKILEQRGLKKLLSTYVHALPKLVVKDTDRLHTSYNQALVVTGRLSSSNPNLQNIPIRDDEGREIRKAFTVTDDNHVFLSADYSQVELRLMAHLSKDAHMLEAFNRGDDIHAATAARIFSVPQEEVTSDMRRKAKTANFGIIYGISAFGLSERLNIPRGEAKSIIDGYFENFEGVKVYMEESIRLARDKGFVETIFGRKRYLPDINSRNAVVRGMAERNAINAPIQGTAADIIKMAMVKIQQELNSGGYKTKMILQVHDELNFEVPKEELADVKKLVRSSMESACELSVPLVVDMGEGRNWLEAH
ncbi:DNA polymerase I [Natronoflexus pectinivorans]|uniref:DNA polymerase I n=1 Tax=Natronoflexus pectinivorans TaxID=682526 RepID=A0A4R2GPI0_9BACT|nr:DNA polymerase I [Natronoflexus pectinivorans]TCO10987.1 DNA polymerase I [Natronoflexus pectinivorans]